MWVKLYMACILMNNLTFNPYSFLLKKNIQKGYRIANFVEWSLIELNFIGFYAMQIEINLILRYYDVWHLLQNWTFLTITVFTWI